MDSSVRSDPVLQRLRRSLEELYGERLSRVILFGSRARGDASADSDYDVAVFLSAMDDRWAELDRLARLRVALLDETGAFVDAKPYLSETYGERSPLMHEVREDGIEL
jgi:predicted nucleotidyltransferase